MVVCCKLWLRLAWRPTPKAAIVSASQLLYTSLQTLKTALYQQ